MSWESLLLLLFLLPRTKGKEKQSRKRSFLQLKTQNSFPSSDLLLRSPSAAFVSSAIYLHACSFNSVDSTIYIAVHIWMNIIFFILWQDSMFIDLSEIRRRFEVFFFFHRSLSTSKERWDMSSSHKREKSLLYFQNHELNSSKPREETLKGEAGNKRNGFRDIHTLYQRT